MQELEVSWDQARGKEIHLLSLLCACSCRTDLISDHLFGRRDLLKRKGVASFKEFLVHIRCILENFWGLAP